MKRRITIQDLQQLTPEQKQRLYNWWKPELGDHMTIENGENEEPFIGVCTYIKSETNEAPGYPLLDICQMIELLGEEWYKNIFEVDGCTCCGHFVSLIYKKTELCDALWEAVKAVL